MLQELLGVIYSITMENGVKQRGVISPIFLAYTLILYYYNYVI